MFTLAVLIGLYSYSIFSLGILGQLYKSNIVFVTLVFILFVILILKKNIRSFKFTKFSKISIFFLSIIIIQSAINFIGVLGPELGFDALWYHLTLPKIYLINHRIEHIPGGLLYYSDIPKLTEMLYTSALSEGSENLAKAIHYLFGILSLIVLYKLAKKILDKKLSFLTVVLFSSNLVFGWEGTSSYVDLARTFFEILALFSFILWIINDNKKWILLTGVMIGLSITSKLLSLSSLLVFSILIIYLKNKKFKELIQSLFILLSTSLIIPLPWFIFSYIHTGNPVYPLFSNIQAAHFETNLFNFPRNTLELFIHPKDPISPFYLISLPVLIWYFKKLRFELKILLLYFLIAIFLWNFTPQGSSRFIMPYLPVLSIVSTSVLKILKNSLLKNFLIVFVVFLSVLSIFARSVANAKYIPVILGKETKSHFLENHLNFSYGDFYDIDNYFKTHIKQNDKVLLYGFHNLFYIDFPFIDSSYVKRGDKFNYVAVQNEKLLEIFKDWRLIYSNSKTHVKLYSQGGQMWTY